MILRKTRSVRFNLGNYEHQETYAVMEINTEVDTEFAEKPLEEVMDYIDDQLIVFLESDVYQARKITDNRDSAAFPFAELHYRDKR